MKRLVFIVEGHTEILLVDKVISPYLNNFGIYSISCQTITTNRKLNKKGGVGSYGLFKNEIKKTLVEDFGIDEKKVCLDSDKKRVEIPLFILEK